MKKPAFILIGLIILCIILRIFLVEFCAVSSGSMEPTLHSGDWLLLDKISYGANMPRRWADIPLINIFTWIKPLREADENRDWGYRRMAGFSSIKVGDIIVFAKTEDRTALLVKRVNHILSKGTIVNLTEDNYTILKTAIEKDGNIVDTTNDGKYYINGKTDSCYKLKQSFYYVLGDNYNNSTDSRVFGYIPESTVEGKVSVVLFSTNKISRIFHRVK